MLGPPPEMKGFFQHLTFHLWLFLPLFLLLVPSEPKFVEGYVQNFLQGRKSRQTTKWDWENSKLRPPIFSTFVLAISAFWGLLWALLHLHSNSVSSSIVGGIIFWTSIFIVLAGVRLVSIVHRWLPMKLDPEIESVSKDWSIKNWTGSKFDQQKKSTIFELSS